MIKTEFLTNNARKIFSSKLFFLGVIAEMGWLSLYLIPLRWPDPSMPISLKENLWLLGSVFAITGAISIIGYFRIQENSATEVKTILLFFFLFGLTNILLPPLGSADVLNYIMSGRVITIEHQNPYIFPTSAFEDPNPVFAAFGYRHGLELVYGPLWAGITAAIAWLGQNNFTLSVVLFQFFSFLASIATLLTIYRIAQKTIPQKAVAALFLLAWNPLWIFETINNAHNETFMILFFSLSLLALIEKRWLIAVAFLIFSILIKYIYLMILPFFIWYILKTIQTRKHRFLFCIQSIVVAVFIFMLSFTPFWEGKNTFVGFEKQSKIFVPIALAPLKMIIYASLAIMNDVLTLPLSVVSMTQFIALLIFSVIILGLFISLKEETSADHWQIFLQRSAWTLILFLILLTPTFTNWYSLWVLPLAVLWRNHRNHAWQIILLFTGTSLFTYIFNRNSNSLPFLVIITAVVALSVLWKKIYQRIWRNFYGPKISLQ